MDNEISPAEMEEGTITNSPDGYDEDALLHNLEAGQSTENPTPDFDSLARQTALNLYKIYSTGGQVAFILAPPNIVDGLKEKLNEMPENEYPQILKDQLPFFGDPDVENIRIVTLSELELQFLEQYFVSNGVLPRLQQFLQNTGVALQITPSLRQEMAIPVQLTLETLRTMYLWEQKERLMPRVEKVLFGADIQKIVKGH